MNVSAGLIVLVVVLVLALLFLFAAELDLLPREDSCPGIGSGDPPFGDVNCDGAVDEADAQHRAGALQGGVGERGPVVQVQLRRQASAQDRLSYHVLESYMLRDEVVPYGSLRLQESDIFGADYRALPPAEHMVLVSWYENEAQRDLAGAQNGFVYVRLGR